MKKTVSAAIGLLACTMAVLPMAKADASLSVNSITMKPGEKIKLASPKKASKVKWSSSKPRVAAVTKKGVVKAYRTGKTNITMKNGKKKSTIKVTVRKKIGDIDYDDVPTLVPVPITAPPVAVATVKPTSTPKVTSTPKPTATVKPTEVPADIRSYDAYICDIDGNVLYLSQKKDYSYYATMTRSVAIKANITNGDNKISYERLEVGDHITVTLSGALGLTDPIVYKNVLSIAVKDKNPEMIGKKYSYTVTKKDGDIYSFTDESGRIFSVDHTSVIGGGSCHFFAGNTEVKYDDLKVGDKIYLYRGDGKQCNPQYGRLVEIVVIE